MSSDQPLSKEKILQAAEQVFRRYGPDKTSVVDIAKMLHVSHGTLYRHFESKAALREAVTERWLNESIAEPLEKISLEANGSATECLRTWLETLIQFKRTFSVDDPEMFAMYSAVTMEAVEMIAIHVSRLIRQMASLIEQGMKENELKSGDPEVAARAIFTATSSFHHPAHASEWLSETKDKEFDELWKLLLLGLSK